MGKKVTAGTTISESYFSDPLFDDVEQIIMTRNQILDSESHLKKLESK